MNIHTKSRKITYNHFQRHIITFLKKKLPHRIRYTRNYIQETLLSSQPFNLFQRINLHNQKKKSFLCNILFGRVILHSTQKLFTELSQIGHRVGTNFMVSENRHFHQVELAKDPESDVLEIIISMALSFLIKYLWLLQS